MFHTTSALCALVLIAVSKTLITKKLFDIFDAPVVYSNTSCIITAVCIGPILWFREQRETKVNRALGRDNVDAVLLASIMVGLDLTFTNIALSLLNVPLQQAIRAGAPAVTIVLQTWYEQTIFHPILYLVVFTICIGPIIMQIGKFEENGDTSYLGIVCMTIAVVSSSLKNVYAHSIIKCARNGMGTLSFTFSMEIIVGLLLLPWSFSTGEYKMLQDMKRQTFVALIFTAFYGGVRVLSQFYFLKYTSPTSLALTGVCTQLLTTMFAMCLFKTYIDRYMIAGISISLLFSLVYSVIKINNWYSKKKTLHWCTERYEVVVQENK